MSVWVGRWRFRCRVEGRRFSGSVEAKRDASPRSVHLRGRLAESGRGGLPALWRNAKEVLRERNLGAVTEPVRMVSGFGRQPPPRSPVRDGFLTPIRSPAAPETSTSTGASRKIGGKTACGSMRPGPTALRYLCGRNGCHPPGRHSRDGAKSRDTPPAFRRQCRSSGEPSAPPRTARRIPLFGRRRTPETDANRCHTDANHCHSAPMADQSARDALSSLPKP